MNVSGDIMVEYTYDAWGNVLSITGPMASTMGQHNQLRYRGYVYDPETGLYFLNSRFYDPEKGRFINADALTSTGGLLGNNMFAYCINNPVRYRDSAGLAPVETNMTDDPIDDLMDQNEGGGGGGGSTTGNASGGGGSGYGGTGYGGVGTSGGGTGYGGGGTSGGGNGSGSTPGGLGGSVVGGNITGYGHAPNQGVPGSTYTQISSDGKATVVSQTTYNEHGLRGQRIDYAGRDHNVGLPHIHRISYIYIENMPYKSGEIIERYFGDEEG